MAIKFINAPVLAHAYDVTHIPVDVSRKTGVLMRQSGKGADKDHYESRLRTGVPRSHCHRLTGRYR